MTNKRKYRISFTVEVEGDIPEDKVLKNSVPDHTRISGSHSDYGVYRIVYSDEPRPTLRPLPEFKND